MIKVEHIGIAVKNLEASVGVYERLLGVKNYKREVVESEQVLTGFLLLKESKIELLQGLSDDSVISKFIEKKGEGIHHVAFDVEDIVSEMKRLQTEGFVLLSEEPKKGADNKLVCFVHPKSANGVLIELCQSIKDNNI
ncbi:MAG: methylmalonyl-CoA epimerase [Flavobacterium sp.]|nr:methylmalonyl-CoA epimerase [Pedobacter sp.]